MVIKPNSTTAGSQINVSDREIIILILDYLESKNLNISQVTLERETGLVNGAFSEEVIFLRNLIFEGLWDDAVDYVEPLTEAPNFDYNFFKKIVHKYKYLELLCIKNEIGNTKFSDHAALSCLNDLQAVCDKAEFNEYRLLLSYPRIQDHPEYRDWNPSSARVMCFREVRPMVESVLQVEGHHTPTEVTQSPANRLAHLLIKGLLYETAWRLCPQRAKKGSDDLRFSGLLPKSSPEPDMALLCWLQVIPAEVFTCQFEEKNLPLNYRKFEKPALEATWTEIIQQAPIRAKNKNDGDASSASSRAPVNDRMVQSMVEQMDGFRKKNVGSSSARQRVLSQSFHLGGLGQEDPFVSGIFAGSTPRQSPSRSARADLAHLSDGMMGGSGGRTSGAGGDARLSLESPGEPLSPITEHVGFGEEENESMSLPPTPSPRLKKKFDDADSTPSFEKHPNLERTRFEEDRKKTKDDLEARQRERDLLMAQILEPAAGIITPVPLRSGSADYPEPPKLAAISPLVYQQDESHVESSSTSQLSSSPMSRNASRNVKDGNSPKSSTNTSSSPQKDAAKVASVNRSPGGSATGAGQQPSSRNGSTPDSHLERTEKLSTASSQNSFGHVPAASNMQELEARQFIPIQTVKDTAAIRCAAFHPSGNFYAVGSNSQILRICSYPALDHLRSLRPEQVAVQAPVVDQRASYHKSSVFCMAWDPPGDLLATGSNDKTIKLAGFDAQRQCLIDKNMDLRIHADTIRDIVFMNQASSAVSGMISGSADGKIILTDCGPLTPVKTYNEHTGSVFSLHTWAGHFFVSGSADKTCRLFDIRKPSAIRIIDNQRGSPDTPVTCVRVDATGKVLATTHENGDLMIWDLCGDRTIQIIKAHQKETRGLSIAPKSNLLLTASYDKTVLAHNMEGNLFQPLPAVIAATHSDKVIQCHFHPRDLTFITTSADKTYLQARDLKIPNRKRFLETGT
ncbi:WD repeat-containing protein 47 [Hypsibius exemplaris]|uniref:WD repeat-containing protein 47 n=1 Tax=Hypsibius exemplaris TaxID=2072580 RepID=A0A1W0XAT3_HYPEX|nr:WD repeat-containing protein 47 [Hypsibius exemplaris]